MTALIQRLIEHDRGAMGSFRFMHVMGVTHAMLTLAEAHGIDRERAAVAALLHDASKEKSGKKLEKELAAWGVAIPEEDREHPKVWHGLHAATWARRELGLEDAEILEAVELHTTADAGVCALTKALFIADFTEPGRGLPLAEPLLQAARADLETGFRRTLEAKAGHLLRKEGFRLHARAARAIEAYLQPNFAESLEPPAV